jgi:SAM-dependent methyltransferase
MIKAYLDDLYTRASEANRQNILSLIEFNPDGSLLDLGCDDGGWTMLLARRMQSKNVNGVEIVEDRAERARSLGINVQIGDLARPLTYSDNAFDLIHANQVIEHVPDVDLFTSEIYRVLKPGGRVVVSTENASSWHNIFALLMGWQMFSLSNLSERRLGIGNPMALHRGEGNHLKSWTHKVIFSYRGLKEFFEAHGFKNLRLLGAGYYPLPGVFAALDVRHSHFLALRAEKPKT